MARKLPFLLPLIFLCACQERFSGSDEGIVRPTFRTDSLVTVVSKATEFDAPAPAAFAFRVENTRGEVLRTWESIEEVPATVNLVTGSYRFVAWHGSDEGFPSWDRIYWQGEHKFKVEAGQTVEAPVAIKLGVVQVSVSFDEASFQKYYSAYSADVRTTTPQTPDAGFLNFSTDDAAKAGRFLPGTLRLRLRLTDKKDGKEYLFSPPTPIGSARGAEHYNLNLRVDETKGFSTLVVTTDTEVTEIPIDITNLPSSTLPKAAPRIRSIGYDYTAAPVAYTEGTAPTEKLAAAVDAPGGVRSVRLVAKSAAMRAAWGGAEAIELVGITAEGRRLAETSGFSWPAVLDTPESAAKATARIEIRFDELFRRLGADPADGATGTDYAFAVEVEDTFAQHSTTSATFRTALQILPPDFGWTAPTAGNVWATRAAFDLRAAVDVPGSEPYVEYRRTDQAAWTKGNARCEEIGQGRWRYTVEGLAPSAEYVFRARMGRFATDEFASATEAAPQLPNSDMERWQGSILEAWGLGSDIYTYRPWGAGDAAFWATNNDRTTAYNGTGVTSAANCFSAVSYTVSAFDGRLAAEVRTVSAVGGNTPDIAYGKTAGVLFAGSYSYADSKERFDYGRPWAARPAALEFYYTYSSYNSDQFDLSVELYDASGTKVGSGNFVSKAGATNTDYIKASVPISYVDWPDRAAKISVVFRSSNSAEPQTRKLKYKVDFFDAAGNNVGASEEWNTHTGSILRIDGLNLVY